MQAPHGSVCSPTPPLHYKCYITIIMIKHDSVLHVGLSFSCLFPADPACLTLSIQFRKQEQRASSNRAKEAEGARNYIAFLRHCTNEIPIILPLLLPIAQHQEPVRSLSCLQLKGGIPPSVPNPTEIPELCPSKLWL